MLSLWQAYSSLHWHKLRYKTHNLKYMMNLLWMTIIIIIIIFALVCLPLSPCAWIHHCFTNVSTLIGGHFFFLRLPKYKGWIILPHSPLHGHLPSCSLTSNEPKRKKNDNQYVRLATCQIHTPNSLETTYHQSNNCCSYWLDSSVNHAASSSFTWDCSDELTWECCGCLQSVYCLLRYKLARS